jgi:catechol 2,3-dioxygenase-like lactoylglutathione lyase family enzyme
MTTVSSQIVPPPTEALDVPTSSAPLRLTGWDHIAFSVPNLVEAERWYVDTLGAEVVGRYNWGGDTSHEVNPHEDIRVGAHIVSLFLGDPLDSSPSPRMFHYAFNCRNMDESDTWKAHLESKGIAVRGPIAHHGFGAVSLYFNDPWGTRLEIATWLNDYETAKTEALKRPGGAIIGGKQE